jgi:acyl-CoA dehydrogenase
MISLELSTEQKELQERFRLLAREELHAQSLAVDAHRPGPIHKAYLEFIGKKNLNSFIIPSEYGGEPLDRVSLSLVTEELGFGCAGLASIYAATVHAVSAILIGGSPEQKEVFLPRLLGPSGEVASCCITEPKGGSDTSSFSTTARLHGDQYLLNGSKVPILNAGNATFFVVWASNDTGSGRAGINAFLVPQDTPGISIGPYHDKPGLRCASTATVFFSDVAVPESNLIGLPGSGYLLLMQTLDWGRAFFGAICVGLARAALEKTIDFAKERRVSNRPIIENQGVSFALADLATEIDAARLLVWRACRLMDLKMDYTRESCMAKLFASEAAVRATGEGMQILGQQGYTQPHLMAKWQRDALAFRILEGTNQIQKMIIASQL